MSLGSASESLKVERAVDVDEDEDCKPSTVVLLSFFGIEMKRTNKEGRTKRRVISQV